MITIDDFAKLEFKVGTVVSAEEIEGSDKLLKLKVDFGPKVPSEEAPPHPNPLPQRGEGMESDEIEGSDGSSVISNDSERSQDELSSMSSRDFSTPSRNDLVKVQNDNEKNDIRQILSGIKQWYKPEDLIGKQFVFITNLEPRKMMGLESQGMIIAAEGEYRPVPLIPGEKVPNGAKIR